MISEHDTHQSEELEVNPDDHWIELSNAHRKMLELEQVDRSFREKRDAYLLVIIVTGGLSFIATNLVINLNSLKLSPGIAIVGFSIGIFVLVVSFMQLLTANWELKKSRELQRALKTAVYEATGDLPRGRSSTLV